MATKIERVYNIPLRKAWLKSPPYKRAKRAVSEVRIFLTKHMKSDNVKLGRMLNMKIWEHSIKNPPHHIKVNVIKYEDGIVRAELEGHPIEPVKTEAKSKDAKRKKSADSKKNRKETKDAVKAKSGSKTTKTEEMKAETKQTEAKKETVKSKETVHTAKDVKHESKPASK